MRRIEKLWHDLAPIHTHIYTSLVDSIQTWKIITVCQFDKHINWISLLALPVLYLFTVFASMPCGHWTFTLGSPAGWLTHRCVLCRQNRDSPPNCMYCYWGNATSFALRQAYITRKRFVDCSVFDFEIATNDCYEECPDCLLIGWKVSWVFIVTISATIEYFLCSDRWRWLISAWFADTFQMGSCNSSKNNTCSFHDVTFFNSVFYFSWHLLLIIKFRKFLRMYFTLLRVTCTWI